MRVQADQSMRSKNAKTVSQSVSKIKGIWINYTKIFKKFNLLSKNRQSILVLLNHKDINISKDLWWSTAAVASSDQINSAHFIKSGSAPFSVKIHLHVSGPVSMKRLLSLCIILYFSSSNTRTESNSSKSRTFLHLDLVIRYLLRGKNKSVRTDEETALVSPTDFTGLYNLTFNRCEPDNFWQSTRLHVHNIRRTNSWRFDVWFVNIYPEDANSIKRKLECLKNLFFSY